MCYEGTGSAFEPTPPSWEVKREHTARVAAGLTIGAIVLGIISLIGRGVLEGIWPGHPNWEMLCVILGVACGAEFLTAMILAKPFDDAYEELHRDFRDVQCKGVSLGERVMKLVKFTIEFKPSGEVVTQVLTRAAVDVKNNCAAEELFLREGLTRLRDVQWPEGEDPEVRNLRLDKIFDNERAECKQRVKDTLARFRHLRDLAEGQGYSVHGSWKSYANVPTSIEYEV